MQAAEVEQHGDRALTKGEYRVGISFNPGGHEEVNEIKRRAADLIDYIEGIDATNNPEVARLKALAQSDIETAAMHGVKAATKPGCPSSFHVA